MGGGAGGAGRGVERGGAGPGWGGAGREVEQGGEQGRNCIEAPGTSTGTSPPVPAGCKRTHKEGAHGFLSALKVDLALTNKLL